ncbi:Ureide permease 5 [Capsicum annuum]|uniref:Ureide permease 5 n=1 Tax=Capsicum annuum TaxID=4072 RepID=A0A2G2YDC1_CAPAN|nr:Ureide permease 5 [Capsicum annuum]
MDIWWPQWWLSAKNCSLFWIFSFFFCLKILDSLMKFDMDYWRLTNLVNLSPESVLSSGLKMYMVESKGGAIACMLFSLLLLGTWPALLTLLERRGRLPQHTYLDYTITNFLAAAIIALTFGQFGPSTPERPDFLTQLFQDNWHSVLFAMAGGMFLSLGNLSTQYAFALVGLSVTEVVSASITVVIGTTLNYYLDDKINKAEILFSGVACFLIAVCLGSAVHSSNNADNKTKLDSYSNDCKVGTNGISSFKPTNSNPGTKNDLEDGDAPRKAKFGTAAFLIELEKTRSIKVFGKGTFVGLAITFFAGICFSMFSPAFNLATNDQWHTLKDGSSFKAYINDWNGRGWALLAGLICGFGNGLQFMGGQAAGYAAADAVQALPLVSTFWGVVLFGEYRRSSRKTYTLLAGMLFMFTAAVAILMASSGHRK